jgi:hypothetical protein
MGSSRALVTTLYCPCHNVVATTAPYILLFLISLATQSLGIIGPELELTHNFTSTSAFTKKGG